MLVLFSTSYHQCKSLNGRHHPSGQIIIFHQPRFPWNKGNSLTKPPFGGNRSCEVAIIWPDPWCKACKSPTSALSECPIASAKLLKTRGKYFTPTWQRWWFFQPEPGLGKQKLRIQATKTLPFPWESKTKQRMVFRMIHEKDSLLPMGKVWSLDFLGFYQTQQKEIVL